MERHLDVTDLPHGAVLECLDRLRKLDVKATAYNEIRAFITIEYPDYRDEYVENIIRELLGNKAWNTSCEPNRSFRATAFDAAIQADYHLDEDTVVELPDGKYMNFRDWTSMVMSVTPGDMHDRWINYLSRYENVPELYLNRLWDTATDTVRRELIDIFIFDTFMSMDRLFNVYRIRVVTEEYR